MTDRSPRVTKVERSLPATAAAFLAAQANEPIGMATLVLAVKRELQKLGRLIPEDSPT